MDMGKFKIKQGIIILTYAAAMVLIIVNFRSILAGVGKFFELLMPFFMGIVIAFVLNRPYEGVKKLYVEKVHMKKKLANVLAILTVYLLLVGIIVAVVLIVVPQLVQNMQMFAANIDTTLTSYQNILNSILDIFGMKQLNLSELSGYIKEYIQEIQEIAKQILPQILTITMNVVSGLVNVFLAIAFSIYLMSGKQKIMSQVKRAVRVLVPEKIEGSIYSVTNTIITVFDNYVAGQTLEAIILGSLCFIGMLVLRLDYAGMISVVVAITAMIPIMGAYVGGVIAVILLLCISVKKAIIFLVFFVILQQIENNVIYPRVVGNKIGLPGIWVLLGITIGGKLMGIVGMLFGVPIMTIIYTLFKNSVHSREKIGKQKERTFS